MLQVHRSNRADRLVELLAARLADAPLRDPMATEQVAVSSRGMARWVAHRLAERLGTTGYDDGVCANVAFPSPATIIHRITTTVLAIGDGPDPWQADRLVWPLLELLPPPADDEFAPLRTYLEDGPIVDRRRYGLATRIAHLFARYTLFRPDMIAGWTAGGHAGPGGTPLPDEQRWQPRLWRQLAQRLGELAPAEQLRRAVDLLRDGHVPADQLPSRLSVFGTTALPPLQLELLTALAARSDVSLYAIVPSERLWTRVHETATATSAGASRPLVEPIHPLLSSCGRLARDHQTVLEWLAPGAAGEAVFDTLDIAGDDLPVLARLQADLLADVDRGGIAPTGGGSAAPPGPVVLDPADRSIELHGCHGPGRQVEVLHDVLRRCFEELDDLQPRDVLVITPDIDAYAPLISAVFGRGAAGRRDAGSRYATVPYQLVDRTLRHSNPAADALLAICELADGRVEASAVLDLLARGPVRRRFGFSEDDIGEIHRWVIDCGIHWGVDADHRRRFGQPAERDHTWQRGIDRLLLGVAMADEDDRLVADVVPYDDMESGSVELLDRFVAFRDELVDVLDTLREPRAIGVWADAFADTIDRLMAPAEDGRHHEQLRRAIRTIVDAAQRPDTDGASERELTLDAVRAVLDGLGGEHGYADGYESGAVTFCGMVPMRAIPYRVVCLLGADDGAIPRPARPLGFDLIAAAPQLGDRDPRDEDRLLFLDALLSARDRFVVTYTGRDQRTDERRAPAVPVGELLDVLDRSITPDADGRSASERLVTEHPLQAFSPRNFRTRGADGAPAEPMSFDTDQLAAARAVQSGATVRPDLFPAPLPEPDSDPDLVSLGDLRRFFSDPTRWLFTNRVGTWLREQHEQLDDLEPIETDPLESWELGQSLLDARLAADPARPLDETAWTRATLARGVAPSGTLGRYAVGRVRPNVDAIVDGTRLAPSGDLDPELRDATVLPINVAVDGRRLVGLVTGLHDGVLVRAQYSTLKPKDRLALWLEHLALAAMYPDAGIRCAVAGRPEGASGAITYTFRPLPAAEATRHLADLIALYRRGRCEPLPLFARSSAAYAEVVLAAGDGEEPDLTAAEKAARKAWQTNARGWGGDLGDAHVAACYGDDGDIATVLATTDFAEVALAVWRPILTAEVVR